MEISELIERISMIRTSAGLSARELSLRIGKNENYISRLEYKKDFNPSVKTIKEILEICGVTEEEFYYHSILDYKKDKELIDLLHKTTSEKKDLALQILKM